MIKVGVTRTETLSGDLDVNSKIEKSLKATTDKRWQEKKISAFYERGLRSRRKITKACNR